MITLWTWWSIMLCNSVINIYIWNRNRDILAFFYVFTNVYRSTFPVMHYTNTCMFSVCSLFIERSLSTNAELAFVIQLLNWFEVSTRYKVMSYLSICFAELCCWLGVINGHSYLHAIEDSIWLCNAIFLSRWLKYSKIYKSITHTAIANVSLYCFIFYMFTYDIPSYIFRPKSSKTTLLICENISTDIVLWNKSLIWMTGYFTFGSWISLAISSNRQKIL